MAMTQLSITRSVKSRQRLTHILLHIVLIALGFTFLVPLLWLISTSLKRGAQVFVVPVEWIPSDPQWSNFREIFEHLPFALFILNTASITIMGVIGSVLSSLTVGYSLARLRWPGRNFIFIVLLATMMLPHTVLLVPTFVMFKYLGWLDTFYPLFVPSWFGSAFYIFLMRQFMMGLPTELDEAARIDGASSFRILWQLIAPLSGPAVVAVAIFSFLAHYNDFMDPLIYLTSNDKFTIALGLYWFAGRWGNLWHLVMAASLVTIAPTFILFFTAQRYFVQGIQFSGLTGR
jgi:ABC-type glycerol-3-phosphate transport system permease component